MPLSPTMVHASPTVKPSGVAGSQSGPAARTENASGDFNPAMEVATSSEEPPGSPTMPQATTSELPSGELHGAISGATPISFPPQVNGGHRRDDTPFANALVDALLLIYADAVDDLERVRIATDNRVRALRQVKGMEDTPEEQRLIGLSKALGDLEHAATLDLKRTMRIHPLGPWVKRTIGIGEKQAARLLAAIGDPATRPNPAKLWAYCGFHVIDGRRPKHRRGEQSNWNTTAKTRAYLCAESCIKQRHSPFRAVYDREREKWAERDTTDLHKHNHALAVTAKAILKDLWREARATVVATPKTDPPAPPVEESA